MRKSLRKISAAIAGCALAMALTVGAVPNAANAAVKPQCTKDGEKPAYRCAANIPLCPYDAPHQDTAYRGRKNPARAFP